MAETVKELLATQELADFLGKSYAWVRERLIEGRIKAKARRTAKSTFYLTSVREAERVKRRLAAGDWV